MRRPDAWGQFLFLAHRSPEGRAGLPRLPRAARRWPWPPRPSCNLLARLLDRHNGDRVLIFTHDNATVYKIARQFLVPVITHQTKTKERREILLQFNAGDVPDRRDLAGPERRGERPRGQRRDHPLGLGLASASTSSGSGRILRKSGDKEATLYEVVTRGTVEEFTSNRRRQHGAYGGRIDRLPSRPSERLRARQSAAPILRSSPAEDPPCRRDDSSGARGPGHRLRCGRCPELRAEHRRYYPAMRTRRRPEGVSQFGSILRRAADEGVGVVISRPSAALASRARARTRCGPRAVSSAFRAILAVVWGLITILALASTVPGEGDRHRLRSFEDAMLARSGSPRWRSLSC